MMVSLGFIAAYAVLIAVASVIEVPIARGFASVQLNLLIRLGSLVVAILAWTIAHDPLLLGVTQAPTWSLRLRAFP
jgi:hypothetical protein